MILPILIAIAAAVGSGVYLILSRDLFRVIVGLTVLSSAVNLVVFASGRFASTTPPLLDGNAHPDAAAAADPLAQALVLTAIVISFALLCFALLLGARLRATADTDDVQSLRATEPVPKDSVKPRELDW